MKTIKLMRRLLFAVLGVSLLCGVITLANTNRAFAAVTVGSTFEMDTGCYIKVLDDSTHGGLRMRVKMDETTKNAAEAEGNTLFFLLMNKAVFDGANGDFDAYANTTYTTLANFENYGYAKIVADTSKIYMAKSYYWANLLLSNIPAKYYSTYFCVVAGITDGTNVKYASYGSDSEVCKKVYEALNKASFEDEYVETVLDIYSPYGSSRYPVYVADDDQYSVFTSLDGVDYSGKYIDVADGVTRDSSFETATGASFPQDVDLSYDFAMMSDATTEITSDYVAAIPTSGANSLDVDDITAITVDYANEISLSKNSGENSLSLDNGGIKALGTGDKTIRVVTDSGIYKVKVSVVTEILTTSSRFLAVTKTSDADDYYILGADIDLGSTTISAEDRYTTGVDFKGVLDGRGYIIKNMTILQNAQYPSSLMYKLSGTVKNIAFVNASIDDGNLHNGGSGALCRSLTGTIENVYMDVALKSVAKGYACGLFYYVPSGNATVKNCVVKTSVSDGSLGTNYGFGRLITGNLKMENCYYISADVERYTGTYGNSGYATCVKYDDAAGFFGAVTTLPSANGWSKYWSITAAGLNLVVPDIPVSDADITSLFSWNKTEGVVADKTWSDYGKIKYGIASYKRTTNFVDISAYKGKTLKIMLPYSSAYGLAFYTIADASNGRSNADGWLYRNTTSGADTTAEFSITIPETACYVRTTYYNESNKTYTGGDFYAIVVDGNPAISGVRTLLANPA